MEKNTRVAHSVLASVICYKTAILYRLPRSSWNWHYDYLHSAQERQPYLYCPVCKYTPIKLFKLPNTCQRYPATWAPKVVLHLAHAQLSLYIQSVDGRGSTVVVYIFPSPQGETHLFVTFLLCMPSPVDWGDWIDFSPEENL